MQARGLVESWLSAVEAGMRTALRNETKRCIREYADLPGIAGGAGPALDVVPGAADAPSVPAPVYQGKAWVGEGRRGDAVDAREAEGDQGSSFQAASPAASMSRAQWALCQPAQLAILVSNVFWCQAVESALEEASDGGSGAGRGAGGNAAAAALLVLEARCGEQLDELIRLVRGGLNELQRRVSGGDDAAWLVGKRRRMHAWLIGCRWKVARRGAAWRGWASAIEIAPAFQPWMEACLL